MTEIDDIKDIGEEEYIIMNLDSRQMETDGTNWFVKNMRGERGFDEPIPYVTSIELVDSYIPNTFYNVEEYNNVFAFGTLLEHYIVNDESNSAVPSTYAINNENNKLREILHEGENGVPSIDRAYFKFNSENVVNNYVLTHTISLNEDSYTIHFKINGNYDSKVDKFLIHIEHDGSEIKRGILENSDDVFDVTVGRRDDGEFDMYKSDDPNDPDDIPESTHVRVFSYSRVEYPIQNYTADELMETTNGYIKEHLKLMFDDLRDEIVTHMPYETFLDIHLKLERNDKSKRFSFTSKHNHQFFIDLTESRSITQELGFSHAFYRSNTNEEKYTQKMASSDVISSITVNELRSVSTDAGNNTMLYQAFNRLFFESPTSTELISTNLISIEPIFVNDYPYKRGSLEAFGRVSDTLIYYYGLLLLENEYYILPFKESFFNIFTSRTAEKLNPIVLQQENDAFYGAKYTNFLNDKTFVDAFEYTINTQIIESENIINLSGERYVDMVCVEIQNELKRYNAGYNKLYRYYFDDISDLYVTSTKGNVTDLVLRNPRDFGPIARLSKLTIQFIRSDGNPYSFKTIPFYITIAIKYLKPVLRTEAVES